jgi:4-oxalocrotonate tautomerase
MEEPIVPLIQVRLMEEVFMPNRKKEIVSKLTDAMKSTRERTCARTWVTIEEVCNGEWSIGGQAMTTEGVRTLAAAKE